MNRKAAGFTIIELIVVIALLGILSAVALPRFISVTDDAHTASVSGAGAGFATGVALFRAQSIAEGTASGSQVSGFGDGSLVVIGGAPVGTSATLNCVEVWEGLLQTNAPTVVAVAGVPTTADYGVVTDDPTCTYTYKTEHPEYGVRTITYDISNRSVQVSAAGASAP